MNCLAKKYLDEGYLEILKIKKNCLNILETKSFKETHKVLTASLRGFDYDTNYSILWELSCLKDCFGLVEEGFCEKETLEIEVKFYSTVTIEIIEKSEGFDKLKLALEGNLKSYKSSEIQPENTWSQKIFAFFKKI
ncbi:hypothetical protein [Algibacter sp. L1A34]|uniref:hypothetical protein n=1 Tax=Algibacter sp. L1A34 TaxID=2686365 RepID=UPI00131ABBFE|nr:hypothetical protein [Algibacter sp. L1A34]